MKKSLLAVLPLVLLSSCNYATTNENEVVEAYKSQFLANYGYTDNATIEIEKLNEKKDVSWWLIESYSTSANFIGEYAYYSKSKTLTPIFYVRVYQ